MTRNPCFLSAKQKAQPDGSRLIGRLQPKQAKTGRIRCTIAGKRVNQAGTSVISPGPSLPIGVIGIPAEIAETLSVPVRITDRNIEYWQRRVDALVGRSAERIRERKEAERNEWNEEPERNDGSAWEPGHGGKDKPGWGGESGWDGTSERGAERERTPEREQKAKSGQSEPAIKRRFFRNGKPLMLVPGATLKVGDTLERSLRNGDRVVPNRYPSLHTPSVFSVRIEISKTKTIAIHPAICRGPAADFDGDTIGRCTVG